MVSPANVARIANIAGKLRTARDKGQQFRQNAQGKVESAQRAATQARYVASQAAQTTKNVAQQGKAKVTAGLGIAGGAYATVKSGSFGFIIFLSLFTHYVLKLTSNWNFWYSTIVDLVFLIIVWFFLIKPEDKSEHLLYQVFMFFVISSVWIGIRPYLVVNAADGFLPAFISVGLFNPLFTPWWFYCFGYFNNPERTKLQRFIKSSIFLFWFIVLVASLMMSPTYQKQLQDLKEQGTTVAEMQEGKQVIETFTNAIGAVVGGILEIPNQIKFFFNRQFNYALGPSGDYYSGRVEDNQYEKLGVYIEDIAPADLKLYTTDDITIWAVLRAKTIGKPISITDIKCIVEKSNKKVKEVSADPPEIPQFTSLEEVDLACELGKLSEGGSYTVKVQAKFDFATDAYQKAYLIDDERYRALVREEIDIYKEYGIKDKKPIAVYTNGPVGIGIETSTAIIRVKKEYDERGIRLGITIENKWDGEIQQFNKLTFQIPNEAKKGFCDHEFIDYTNEECKSDCDEYYSEDDEGLSQNEDIRTKCKEDCTNFKTYKLNPNLVTELRLQNVEKYQSFSCRIGFEKEVLGSTPITTKYFRVRADYKYLAEEEITISVKNPATDLEDNFPLANTEIQYTKVDTTAALRIEVDRRKLLNEYTNKKGNKVIGGDFRGLLIKKDLVTFPNIDQIKSVIDSKINALTDVPDAGDKAKIKECFLKMLKQESTYRQFLTKTGIDSDYYELVASNTGTSDADGCCVGISQININAHTGIDSVDIITSYSENVRKGFDILMANIRNKNGDLAAAATGYRGAGTYLDHCSGSVTIS